jgi:hypothetical protein
MGTVALIPKCLQFCMSFGGVTGWLGCNLAGLGDIVNALQCLGCNMSIIGDLINPMIPPMIKDLMGGK